MRCAVGATDANSPYGFAGIIITDRNPKMNIVFEAEDDLSANRDFFDLFQDGAMVSAVSLPSRVGGARIEDCDYGGNATNQKRNGARNNGLHLRC